MRLISLTCALLWAALIYYLSDQPSIDIPPAFPYQDKLLHLAAYFVLGLLSLGAMQPGRTGYRAGQAGLAILLAGLYGLSDELHQRFVPGRHASLADVAADFTGVLLGVGLLFLLMRQYSRRTQQSLSFPRKRDNSVRN